jgi:YaiO family outer membrane protein
LTVPRRATSRPHLSFFAGFARLAGALLFALALGADRAEAQAPLGLFTGPWIEAGLQGQRVSGDLGDWRGAWARAVIPAGPRDIVWAEAQYLDAFGERGVQGGITHRHDWTSRVFHVLGVGAADGAPIFPRWRSDAALGLLLGPRRTVVATLGGSYVRSVTDISDAAATASVAWYAPGNLVLETNVRANTSWPGRIRNTRIGGSVTWFATPRRSFAARAIAGGEGYQVVQLDASPLVQFDSEDFALAWRERIGDRFSTSLQFERYRNPFYTRTGVVADGAWTW